MALGDPGTKKKQKGIDTLADSISLMFYLWSTLDQQALLWSLSWTLAKVQDFPFIPKMARELVQLSLQWSYLRGVSKSNYYTSILNILKNVAYIAHI